MVASGVQSNAVVEVFWSVKNVGGGIAQGSWIDSVYFSTNSTLEGQDPRILDNSENSQTVIPGGSYSRSGFVTLPVGQGGTYYLIFQADRNNTLFEANEANNTIVLPVTFIPGWPDTDHDGMPDWMEALAGTDPNDRTSLLTMVSACTNTPAGIAICWRSVNGKLYTLERSTNLTSVPAFTAIQQHIVGQTNTTCFGDLSATNIGPYFYRVKVEP